MQPQSALQEKCSPCKRKKPKTSEINKERHFLQQPGFQTLLHFHSDCSRRRRSSKASHKLQPDSLVQSLEHVRSLFQPPCDSPNGLACRSHWSGDRHPHTHTHPSSPLTGCREIAPALTFFPQHVPNGMAVLQGLHPRAELQLGSTGSCPTHKKETTKKHNPDPQKQMVLDWIRGLNQPRV